MLILTDNDVVGAVRVFQRILASPEWVALRDELELGFIELNDVELPRDAPDTAVWQRSQTIGVVLITGNRPSALRQRLILGARHATCLPAPLASLGAGRGRRQSPTPQASLAGVS